MLCTGLNNQVSLEHICRAHFPPCLDDKSVDAPAPRFGFEGSGHTLMATSVALRDAPEYIFDAVTRSDRIVFPDSGQPRVMRLIPQTSPATMPATTAVMTTTETGTLTQSATTDGTSNGKAGDGGLSWTTTALTLRSLRGLASSLMPDDTELAPVQAWFELASRFGAARLTDSAVLDALKRELAGAVRCQHFGAVISRASFESAVSRVLNTST